ncbi:hypothetical protein [Kurthia sibirica]|uniref:Uncharacterized protein n=1 Tax=Kurthia sibirica TaxID=202750 RepID=A0A2U3ALV3_9BACL|nr:hypothetical protein [Kurthia sibirica]PWI25516.1 hypothetical protein DEX24_07875 [Kurthia sibirica]GEK33994.1 hypothetical protein KSI01_15270 [Kurthia sibirica]
MNLNKLAAYFLPAFTMLAGTALSMTGAFGDTKASLSIFVLCLIIVFPLTFLIQGIACAIHHYHILPAIGISTIAFIVVFMIVLPTDNLVYGVYYLAIFAAGYAITYMIRRMKK